MYYHLPMAKKKSALDSIPLRPTSVDQLNAQALTLLQQGQFQAGAGLLRQSLTQNPQQPEAHYNFGFALQKLGLLNEAIQAYGHSITLAPNDVDTLMARGNVLATQKRYEEAAQDFTKVVKLVPQNADAWNNYGNTLLELAREPEAIETYDKALALRPSFVQALFNKGKALAALECYADASEAYETALSINPNYEEAKWHLSWVRLVLGDFDQGWKLFESRWSVAELGNQRRYAQLPHWLGQESISGKSILLYNEQGLGDTLQFCRYAPQLQAMGAKVSLAVQAPLVSLLRDQWPGVTVADVARQYGTTRWQVYDWRKKLRTGQLVVPENIAALPAFAELVVELPPNDASPSGSLHDIEIVVGDLVIRAGSGADEGQLTRAIRAARAAASRASSFTAISSGSMSETMPPIGSSRPTTTLPSSTKA